MLFQSYATVVLRIFAAVPLLLCPAWAVAQPSGPVAAYTFNETSGTTALDASGNGNNGVLTNGPVWVGGKHGNGVRLDGVNDYVNLGNPASLRLTGSMTLSAWMNSSAFPVDDAAIISKRQSTSTGYQLDTTKDKGPRTIGWKISDASGKTVARYGATTLLTNTWYHVAGVYDAPNRTLTVYLNGQLDNGSLVGTIPAAQPNSTQNVQVGQQPGSPGTYNFAGLLDDVRLYNRALTQAEIQTDMLTPVGGTPGPDTTAPTVVITSPTATTSFATNVSPLPLGGTAADNVGVTQVTWGNDRGGSGTAAGTTSWSASGIGLQPGPNVLTVTARDAAGNPGAATLTVTYDTTVPTVLITTPTAGATYTTNSSPLPLAGTAADNVGVTQVMWGNDRGGSGTAAGTTSWSASGIGLQPGPNVLTVTARDAAGDTGTATLTVTYTAPDTTAPTVAITLPTAGASYPTNTSSLTLAGTAADNVGVTQVTWGNDRGGSDTATGTTSWSASGIGLQPGPNVLTVTARDAAGNPGTATVTVTYDATPPTVSLTGPASGATVAGTTPVTATAADNIGVVGVQFLLDNSPLGGEQTGPAFSLSWTTTSVLNGAHTLSARARDAAGNITLAPIVAVTVANTQLAGLMAAYAFEATSGTTALDASGNGNNGVLTNGPVWVVGKHGNGVRLDGGNDYVNLGNPASLRLTGSMTLSAWINSSAFPVDDAAIISKRQSSSTGYQLDTTIDVGPRTIGLKIADGAGNNVARYGTTAMAVNTWYHVAGVYDATNRTLNVYINGQLVNGALVGTIPAAQLDSTQNVHVGQRPGAAGNYNFAGVLDDVRLYSRALSQTEIQTDMTTPAGSPPPPDTTPPTVTITAPLVGATVFSLVSVWATMSDNVGIAGVQFLLDGTPLGTEATVAPYSVLWDTTSVSLGNHILTAVARDFAGNLTTSDPVPVTVVAATTSRVGQWAVPAAWPIVAVHASLLPTGEVLAWDGQGNGFDARLWNPTSGVFTAVPNNQTNIFCSGHCALADGRTLVAGGHGGGHIGLKDTNLFNPTARTWTKVASMSYPRWYPTTTTLPDGRVLVTAGEINCNGCVAVIPEIYNPQTNVWTKLSGASLDLPYYPHMFVLPDGRVLAAATSEDIISTQVLNVNTQTWSLVDANPVDGGSSAMYLPGKVIKSGTSADPDLPIFPSAATTYVLDMTQPSPAWQETAPMAFPRTFHTLTLLPDGTVLVTGGGDTTDTVGVGVNNAVFHAELWSPVTKTWTTMASMQKPRLYHSTALLLPDGRVLAAGGGRFNGVNEPTDQLSSETYSPPYLFNPTTGGLAARPTISSAPATATYGGTIVVQTPDAAQIAAVSLLRLGSVTHAFNQNQWFLQLPFAIVSGAVNVQAPANANLAPPGYYMLFILDTQGVPSVAATLKLQ